MTRAEAVTILRNEQPHCGDRIAFSESEKYEALNMAIKALEQQTCNNCKFNEETNGMNCYECVKGISDNFEALESDEQ